MSKKEQRKAPVLRFKGFTDDWELHKLDEIVKFYGGLTYHPENIQEDGTLVLRSSNIHNNQIVLKDTVHVSPEIVNTSNVNVNDIIVVVRNGSRKLIGKHARVLKAMPNTVIGAFMTGIRSQNSKFVNALFDGDIFQREIYKNLGATINQITIKSFKEMEFYIPQNHEKQIIGNLISQIDNLLALQQRKLNELKEVKKTLLSQLFPSKGQYRPIIRFKKFTNKWTKRKLGNIAKIIGGGTPSTSNHDYWNGNINWYSPTEIGNNIFVNSSNKKISIKGLNNSSAKLLPGGKTILFTSRAGIGNMAIMLTDGCTNQGFQSWVIDDTKIDIYFLYSLGRLLKHDAIRQASGSTFLEISNKEVKKLLLEIPSFTEQKLIGNMLRKIDDDIVRQKERIILITKIKKNLLQKLFV